MPGTIPVRPAFMGGYHTRGAPGVRELIVAAVGAILLIGLGLASVNASERSGGDATAAAAYEESVTGGASLMLAD
jgi:hypothetical protein